MTAGRVGRPGRLERSWRARTVTTLAVVLVVSACACADAAPLRSAPGPLRAAVLDGFTTDLRALADGDVAPEFGGLASGQVTEAFTRARAGAGLLAAALSRARRDPELAALSRRTWAYVLDTAPVRPDGAIGGTQPDRRPDDVQTMFLATSLGMSLLELRDTLPGADRDRWTSVLLGAARFLRDNGNITFYTNGNVNLGNTLLFRIVAEVTGDRGWRRIYERSLAFTLDPPPRWDGFGLTVTREPTRADGADGAGYLAERGAGGTGFDADYGQVQADLAARLYLVDRDVRILRLLNLLTNSLLPRVDAGAGTLDTSGGTRLTAPNRKVGFVSGAVSVLDLVGCRAGLGTTSVALGRATARSVHSFVEGRNARDYVLLALGPPNTVAALSDASSGSAACPPEGP